MIGLKRKSSDWPMSCPTMKILRTMMDEMLQLVDITSFSARQLRPTLVKRNTILFTNLLKTIDISVQLFTTESKEIALTRGSTGNVFIAQIDKDIHFEIIFTNRSDTRDMRLSLSYNKTYHYIFEKSGSYVLKTLDPPNGHHLKIDTQMAIKPDTICMQIGFRFEAQKQVFNISVKTESGQTLAVEMDSNDTILTLKRRLKDIADIHPERQRLVFNRQRLLNYITVDGLGISEDSTLHLYSCQSDDEIPIFILMSYGLKQVVKIGSNDTIGELKRRLADITDISVDQQVISYRGQRLADTKTVDEYGISDESTLHLYCRTDEETNIFVETSSGKTFLLTTIINASIDCVKELIQDQEFIPPDQQLLKFNDKSLDNRQYSLFDYDIFNKSTISLLAKRCRGCSQTFVHSLEPLETYLKTFIADTHYELIPFCIEFRFKPK